MNKTIRTVSGTLIQSIADDKLEALAKLLGLDAGEAAKLKTRGRVMVVVEEAGKSAG